MRKLIQKAFAVMGALALVLAISPDGVMAKGPKDGEARGQGQSQSQKAKEKKAKNKGSQSSTQSSEDGGTTGSEEKGGKAKGQSDEFRALKNEKREYIKEHGDYMRENKGASEDKGAHREHMDGHKAKMQEFKE